MAAWDPDRTASTNRVERPEPMRFQVLAQGRPIGFKLADVPTTVSAPAQGAYAYTGISFFSSPPAVPDPRPEHGAAEDLNGRQYLSRPAPATAARLGQCRLADRHGHDPANRLRTLASLSATATITATPGAVVSGVRHRAFDGTGNLHRRYRQHQQPDRRFHGCRSHPLDCRCD